MDKNKPLTPKGQATKRRIVFTAMDLFHAQGVRGTSPGQVMEASGTGKGQFYHYFDGKDGLVHEVLLAHIDGIRNDLSPIHYDLQTWEDLESWFRTHMEYQVRHQMSRGCPIGTIANEIHFDDREVLRQDLVLLFEVMRNKLAAFFLSKKARNELGSDVEEKVLADFCIATVQGALLLAKTRRDPESIEATITQTLRFLRGLEVS